jgi:hypothetical protein
MPSRNLIALLPSIAIACGGSAPEPQPEPTPTSIRRDAPKASPKAPEAKPLALPPSEPGAAYISVSGGVAVILADGTPQLVAGIGQTSQLVVGGDGAAYATAATGTMGVEIYKLTGATATKVGAVRSHTSTALAVGNDGVGYIAANDEVLRFDAKSSKTLGKPGLSSITQLAVDADGNVVAAGNGGASLRVGDAWKRIELPGVESYTSVWLLGQGAQLVVAVERSGFFSLAGGKVTRILGDARPELSGRRPSLASTGILASSAITKGRVFMRLFDRNSGATTTSDRTTRGLARSVIDARGRLWYVDSGALVVDSLLGKERTEYPIGTLPVLVKAGYASSSDGLVVLGGGPSALPPVADVQVVDAVTGTISIRGAPLAGAKIEICTYASFTFTYSPCDADRSRIVGTTNDKGEFSLAKVPLGVYQLAFNTNGKWGLASGASISLLKSAPTHSVGTLRYN